MLRRYTIDNEDKADKGVGRPTGGGKGGGGGVQDPDRPEDIPHAQACVSDPCYNLWFLLFFALVSFLSVRSFPRHLGRIRYRVLADQLGRTGYKTGSVKKVSKGKDRNNKNPRIPKTIDLIRHQNCGPKSRMFTQ